jgi:glycosyltransferase involved in cell wall biosynthesis
MKLLYFSAHEFWPVNFGAPLRNYQLARHLASHSSVTFVELRGVKTEQNSLPDDSGLAGIVTLKKGRTYTPSKIFRGLVGPTPLSVLNCWSRRSAFQLEDLVRSQQFATAQIEGVHLIKYLPIIQNAPAHPTIVVDWHNIESEGMWRFARNTDDLAKRIVAKRTAKLLERAEAWLLDNFSTHTVTSERERQELLVRRPDANVQVIPNGVDTRSFEPKFIADAFGHSSPVGRKPTLLFVGHLNYHANVDAVTWFCRTAWPEIARHHPDLQFTIVGRDPAPEVRALASDRIHVTGTVEDVRPFYASAVAAVVPIRTGSGTRLKILEAMAAGVPVVSTRLGAEGIEAEDNVHLLLADSEPEIVAAIHRLVWSRETRCRLSHAARSLVCGLYDWSAIGKRLYRIHADLAKSGPLTSARVVSEA